MREKLALPVIVAAASLMLLAGCQPPLGSAKGGTGSLQITLVDKVNARTLGPTIGTTVDYYTVTGTGPNGASFTRTSTGGTVTQDNLAAGNWTLVVNALSGNFDVFQLLGTGSATAPVNNGAATPVTVTVTPVAGIGGLELTVTWASGQLQNPSIIASLTPALGNPLAMTFAISGASATYSNYSIGNGYYTLAISLLDNGNVVGGAVDVVRIVTGMTTSGTYTLHPAGTGGSIQVNVALSLQDPLLVSIAEGQQSPLQAGASQTLSASVSNYSGNVVYVWYVNGVSRGTGSSFTFGQGLSSGNYRIDATAFAADGTQAGSATLSEDLIAYYLYSANSTAQTVTAFAIGTGGALTPITGPYPTDLGSTSIVASPNAHYLYVTNTNHDTLSSFNVGANGALSLLSTFPPSGAGLWSLAVTPNGNFLYIDKVGTGQVIRLTIGTGGLPTFQGATALPGRYSGGMAVSADGAYLYAVSVDNSSGSISAFTIGAGGALSANGAYPFAGVQQAIGITPNGSYLYTSAGTAYSIGAGGVLSAIGTFVSGGANPVGITFSPDSQYLFMAGHTSISEFRIGAGGALTALPATSAGTNLQGIAISPDGQHLYVTDFGNNSIVAFAVGSGGALSPLGSFATDAGPEGLAIVRR
jgi:6-phosphogluconolactonase (cycloisomerase 2 family)